MSGYNGWTNYETWAVALHIDNDPLEQGYWLAAAQEHLEAAEDDETAARYSLAEGLKESYEDNVPELTGAFADLLYAALDSVNWQEIAEHLIEAAKEIGE